MTQTIIDMTDIAHPRPANFTRQSRSFISKFAREGRFHLIPLYWLLLLSDFAREGMEHSGSYRFADHMYRGVPSGRGWIGRWLDGVLLRLPATRSMRQRCFEARDAMRTVFDAHIASGKQMPFEVLTVPCGLPRDVRDFVQDVARDNPDAARTIQYTGMDIDPEVITAASAFLEGTAVSNPCFHLGNALKAADYPESAPHFVSSTGLGEFLSDSDLEIFYGNVFEILQPGGTFFTSAAARGNGSDALLRAFELDVHYRTANDITRLLDRQPWESVTVTRDPVGLQTFVRAVKPS